MDRPRFVDYTIMYQKAVQVSLTEEEYHILHQPDNADARASIESDIVDRAILLAEDEPIEWTMSICTDEEGEELFDRGC